MELSWGLFAFAFFVEFFCYMLKGITGFGETLISGTVLSMTMDNKVISPLNLIMSVPANGWITWKNRKAFSMREAIPTAVWMNLGVIPGTWLLKYGTSWVLKACLGVLVLGLAFEMISRHRAAAKAQTGAESKPPNKPVLYFISFVSGVTGGLYGISMLLVAYIERTTGDRSSFRGNVCFLFFTQAVFTVFVYLAAGLFTRTVLLLAAVCLPGMALGLFIGSKLDRHVSDSAMRWLVIALFLLGGVSLLVKALVFRG